MQGSPRRGAGHLAQGIGRNALGRGGTRCSANAGQCITGRPITGQLVPMVPVFTICGYSCIGLCFSVLLGVLWAIVFGLYIYMYHAHWGDFH